MALAEKYGHDKYRWIDNVEKYVLLKSKPEYYNDSVCRNGYFRGLETYNFVREIRARHNIYKEKIKEWQMIILDSTFAHKSWGIKGVITRFTR